MVVDLVGFRQQLRGWSTRALCSGKNERRRTVSIGEFLPDGNGDAGRFSLKSLLTWLLVGGGIESNFIYHRILFRRMPTILSCPLVEGQSINSPLLLAYYFYFHFLALFVTFNIPDDCRFTHTHSHRN